MMDNDTIDRAIAVNIETLGALIDAMAACADEALGYVRSGRRNAAIGTIIDIGGMLADATALHAAALALHRRAMD